MTPHERQKRKVNQSQKVIIHLQESQILAVEAMRKRCWRRHPTYFAHVAEYILWVALLHPDQLQQWFVQIGNYCEAEGLDEYDYLERSAAQVTSRKKGARR